MENHNSRVNEAENGEPQPQNKSGIFGNKELVIKWISGGNVDFNVVIAGFTYNASLMTYY